MPKNKQEPFANDVHKGRLDALRMIADRKNRISGANKTNAETEADTLLLLIVEVLHHQEAKHQELVDAYCALFSGIGLELNDPGCTSRDRDDEKLD